jgi:hypothetical protein
MKVPLLFGLGVMIALRLVAMFARERLPTGSPLKIDGDTVQAHVGRGKYRRIDSLAVGFDAPHGWRFNLRREGWFDRFAKSIGLATEFQTHDTPFDGRIYIECDDAALHRQLGSRRDLRNQLFNLFGLASVKGLECAGGQMWFRLGVDGLDKNMEDETIGREAAKKLQAGVRALREQMAVIDDDPARDPTRVTRRYFAITILALAVVGAIGAAWQYNHEGHQVVVDNITHMAIGSTVAITIGLLGVMFLALGGTARVQRVLLDILIAGIPAAWLASSGGVMYFNESFDASAARRVPVPVERAWVTTSRKGRHSYYASLHWQDVRATSIVQLRPDEYDQMQSQTCVDVLWRAGRFGDGWVERYQTHNVGNCDEGVEK